MKKIFYLFCVIIAMVSCVGQKNIIEEAVSHYDNGNPKIVYYYKILEDGKQEWIRETWFYQEGMKHLDGPIVNDKRNGIFETYYKSGQLMSKGEFIDGKREGKATTYHENGKIKYEGQYKDGKECGIWKFYDEEGKLYNEVNRDLI